MQNAQFIDLFQIHVHMYVYVFAYATILCDTPYMCICFVNKHASAEVPSCTSVSDPGFLQGSCGWAAHQHHNNQYKPISVAQNAKCH